jgi:hypothetical protein
MCPALDELVVPDVVGILLTQLIGQRQQLLLGGVRSHTRREPPPHLDVATGGIGQHLAPFNKVRLLRHGQPEVRVLAAETGKGGRSHAENRHHLFVQVDDLAHYGWVRAKTSLPEPKTQHHARGCVSGLVSRRIEQPSTGCQ